MIPMSKRNKLSRGFTLAELLVASSIMAYTLAVMVLSLVRNYALNETSRNLTYATNHAETVLEDIRNTSFASVASGITAGNWNWTTSTLTTLGLSPIKGETITTTYSGTQLLTITVTIAWQDLNSRSQSKSLTTQMGGS